MIILRIMILILQSICNDTPEIPKSEKVECAQHISTSVNNKRGDKRPALLTCTKIIVDLSQKSQQSDVKFQWNFLH